MIESDEKFEPIRKACKQLGGQIARLKQAEANISIIRCESDPGFEMACEQLAEAIKDYVPEGTRCRDDWWFTVTIDNAYNRPGNDPGEITRYLESEIEKKLPDMDAEWIALTPLGRQFSAFPEFSDFGDFAIINPSDSDPAEAKARLKAILSEQFSVNFIDSEEIDASFDSEADNLAHASLGYFPLRPQLVIRLGRGLAKPNFIEFPSRLHRLAPLIVLSELAAELLLSRDDPRFDKEWKLDPSARLPDGSTMPFGLVKVPDFVILMNVHRGDVWTPGPFFQRSPDFGDLPFFETNFTPLLDFKKFKEAWETWRLTIWVLVEEMKEAGVNQKFRDAFEGSIRVVAQCRHWRACRIPDPNLYAVIATETLLNPFGKSNVAERFAAFGAALCEEDPAKRTDLEAKLKELYDQRCDFVHASGHFYSNDDDPCDDLVSPPRPEFALRHFFRCLLPILVWASEQLPNGKPLSETAFEKFQRTTVGNSVKIGKYDAEPFHK